MFTIALIFAFNAVFCFAPAALALRLTKTPKQYTVSWFDLPGFQETDGKGKPYGYIYEYLTKLAEYGNFIFKYIHAETQDAYPEEIKNEQGDVIHNKGDLICNGDGVLSHAECYDLAKYGFLDILTCTLRTEQREKELLFSNNDCGKVYYTLFTDLQSGIKSVDDLYLIENLTVAMVASPANEYDFANYAEAAGLNYTLLRCEGMQEIYDAVKQGRAHAIVNTGYISYKQYNILARFSPKPMYFWTAKNNGLLMSEINYAMDSLAIDNPTFTTELYNKYFQVGVISISQEEVIAVLSLVAVMTLLTVLIVISRSTRERNRIIYRDRLTGAYSQLGFEVEARRKINKLQSVNFFVIDFDIDNFEIFNNVNGYEEGDKLLIELANISSVFNNEYAVVARYEADHFVKLVCAPSLAKAEEVLLAENQRLVELYPDYPITITYGIYEVNDRSLPVSVMRDRACVAKRSVKNVRNQIYGIYKEMMHQKQIEENQLLRSLEEALASKRFVPFYQPKVDTKTEKPVGLEALARLIKENGEVIPPAAFIAPLEKTGLITQLDFLIYTQVCDMLKKERAEGKNPLPVSVNFSRSHVYDVKFVNKLIKIAADRNIPCDLLEIELTESIFIADRDAVVKVVNNLHHAGFTVSIDDFGSGFSSLTVLKDVFFDVVKLDKQFLSSTSSNERCLAIVESSVTLAKQLGLVTIAEGVESKEQLEFLRTTGCDRLQGFFFARPMPYDQLTAYLEAVSNAPKTSLNYKEIIASGKLPLLNYAKGSEIKDKQRFQAMFDSMPLGLSVWGFSNNRLYEINKATLDILGRTKEEIEFTYWDAFVHQDDKKVLEDMYRRILNDENEKVSRPLRFYRADGKLAYIYFTIMAFGYNEKGENLGLCIMQDQTYFVRQEERIRLSEERFRMIENTIDEVVFDIDVINNCITFLVKGAKPRKIDNYVSELEDKTYIHPDDLKRWKGALQKCINTSGACTGKLDCRSTVFGNGYIWCRYFYTSICDGEGKATQIVGRIEDINDEMANLIKLRNDAQFDPLTKLYNRDNMAFKVESIMVTSPPNSSHACFMIDVDNFRNSNAKHGHLMSDRILVKFAEIIKSVVSEKDLVSRIGGDEFLVFVLNATKEKAKELGEKIVAASIKFNVNGIGEVKQGCSIGGALFYGQNISYSQLVTQADSAMYYAKQHGKSQVVFYDEIKKGK